MKKNEVESDFSANVVCFLGTEETKLYINKGDKMLVLTMEEIEKLKKVIHNYPKLKMVSNCYVNEESK